MGVVFNLERESASLVCALRINGSLDEEVFKFSESRYVPTLGRDLKLATPAYYRKGEHLDEGIYDPQDGTQIMDVSPYMAEVISTEFPQATINSLSACFTMTSCWLPWVYCASQPRNQCEFNKLKELFRSEYGYSGITRIKDPSAFALQLGLDFVISQDFSSCVKPNWIDTEIRNRSNVQFELWDGTRPIDTAVQVFHGPVEYADQSGIMGDLSDFGRLVNGTYATFTKRTKYCAQAEYRFAVSTFGTVKKDPLFIPVSEELAKLVFPK